MPVGYLDANRRPLRCHENVEVFAQMMADYTPLMEMTTAFRATVTDRGGVQAEHYNHHHRNGYRDTGARYPRSVWRFAQRNTSFQNTRTLHPTEKPLLLMERLVLTFSEIGALIIDPFAGSGTTGFAAIKHGRRFVGSDNGVDTRIGRTWAEIANARLCQPFTMPLFAAEDAP